MTQRDVVFLVADGSMEQMLRGFFDRPQFPRALGCGRFEVDLTEDIIVAPNRDPQVYRLAHELLGPYRRSHTHAVVMLDDAWGGSPGVPAIRDAVGQRMQQAWDAHDYKVIDRADRSKAVFRRVAEKVSVKGCQDEAFLQLRDTLRDWFPEDSL